MKNFEESQAKEEYRMVSRSWQNCLEGPQNCSQGRGFCLFFFALGPGFRKNFLPGGRESDYHKKFPGGGGCWCLELTDALLILVCFFLQDYVFELFCIYVYKFPLYLISVTLTHKNCSMLDNLICKQKLEQISWELKLLNFSPSSFQDSQLLTV